MSDTAANFFQRQAAICRGFTGTAAEADDVQKCIAHQAVAAVNTAGYFAGAIEAFNAGCAVAVDFDTAVLIVQGWMNHDRFNSRVNAAFVGDVAECYQTVQYVRVVSNQARGVEEYADLTVSYYAAAFAALAQNRSGNNVARLQFRQRNVRPNR